jgi:hypothetical protein
MTHFRLSVAVAKAVLLLWMQFVTGMENALWQGTKSKRKSSVKNEQKLILGHV